MVRSMNCFPCFSSQKSKRSHSKREHGSPPHENVNVVAKTPDVKKQKADEPNQVDTANIQAYNFTFRELATATKNFRQECLMTEGGFGRVYKGTIPTTGQVVAVKQLDRNGMQGSKEFLAEVLTLSLLHHENLVNLVGYCADGDQRLLVYEFVPGRTLEDRLLENKADLPSLDWFSRMKVAVGAARGLEYLHDIANPPVIHRDLKASNILLDNDLNAKLSDFGLAKLSGGDKMNPAPPRVMGTYGYSAPEYVRTGHLTFKSDVYSFGVVLLELITGRRVIDTTKPHEEQNLVSWAQPLFRDPKRFPDMADPNLNKHFPEKDLNQAVAIAAMCLQEEAEARPLMSDVVTALSFLSTVPPAGAIPSSLPPATSASKKSAASKGESESESASESESESESASESEAEAETGKESQRRDISDDEDGEGPGHEDNETAQNQAAASAKYQQSVVSDIEDDYYDNENQNGFDSQEDSMESKEFYSKSSRKSSFSSDSEDGSVSSSNKGSRKSHGVIGTLSQKSSRKSSVKDRDLSQKSSKKSSVKDRDLSQKSSKKSSVKDRNLSQKSSRKSSVRVLSHKTSMGMGSGSGSEGSVSFEHSDSKASHGNASLSRNSSSVASEDGGAMFESGSRLSRGNISFGLTSTESVHSDHNSSRRTEEESIHLDHASSRGSDEGSVGPFHHTSSSESDE